MQSGAQTVDEYLEGLPDDRKEAIANIREVIRQNLPAGYEEGMQYGMIGYYVPLSRYPNTYNGQALGYVALASQKNYISIYLTNIYANPDTEVWFRDEYAKTGKKLNMGKSCVRFRKFDDIPMDLIGKTVALTPVEEFIEQYERSRAGR